MGIFAPQMELIAPPAQEYAERFTSRLGTLLQKIERETAEKHPEAHMLSGALQGQVLRQLSLMVRPRRILEIGTFVGFSALCLAEGLAEDGKLHTIEVRASDAETAAGYFNQSRYAGRINLHVGEALAVIEALKETWDLVFIDADKINYIAYYESVLPRLRPGGWILADNALFHGQVLESPVRGKNAKAIDAFNAHVAEDARTEQVMLTVRDGLMMIRKT
jgi:predicted O-methyltransferase YrrM